MTDIVKKRGGAREGAGRPALESKAKNRSIRLSDARYEKFKALGGVKWLAALLD